MQCLQKTAEMLELWFYNVMMLLNLRSKTINTPNSLVLLAQIDRPFFFFLPPSPVSRMFMFAPFMFGNMCASYTKAVHAVASTVLYVKAFADIHYRNYKKTKNKQEKKKPCKS